MFAMYELRMKRPCARDGLTPISSSVRTADDDPEPELGGGGGGEPCSVAGTRCIGGSGWTGAGPAPPTPTTAPAGVATAAPTAAGAGGTVALAGATAADAGGTVAVAGEPG